MPNDDFISRYLEYRAETEPPKIFHRWSIISALSAFLGRQTWVQMGEAKIHPNQFVMLIGVPGTRKSTAIKMAKRLLQKTGYDTFSADKTSKEKFILDLAEPDADDASSSLERALFDNDSRLSSEIYIACDEFNNFIGNGNVEFVSLLGEWWDYEGVYKYRIKSGKSVEIPDPTINILGGNTSTGFNLAFPPQVIGQGFFSRLLLVHSEPSGRKITFPTSPSELDTELLVSKLREIKASVQGKMEISPHAANLLDKIYKDGNPINDVRFEHYANRRFTHLLKLCQVVAASRTSNQITESDVVYANTILSHTESMMPKALGEHGAGKYSEVSHKIIQYLENTPKICSQADIWRQVNQDMDKINDLSNVLMNLKVADKIIQVEGGFIAKKAAVRVVSDGSVDYSLLQSRKQMEDTNQKHLRSPWLAILADDSALDYAVYVEKLKKPLDPKMDLLHMTMGISGESGELIDPIKTHVFYGKELDIENVVEELGDALFYMQGLMNRLGLSWEQIVEHNVGKLNKRYSKLYFTTEDAIARADKSPLPDPTPETHPWGLTKDQLSN